MGGRFRKLNALACFSVPILVTGRVAQGGQVDSLTALICVKYEHAGNEHEGEAAMAHPNEDVIRQMFAAYGRGDEASLRQVLAEDVVYHLPGRSPLAGEYRGRDDVLALWERQKAYMGGRTYRVEPLASIADDQHVVLLARGEAESDSQTLTWRAANVYQLRDAQVVDCRVFIEDLYSFDRFWAGMPAREAVGKDG
jgi:uncharacterized protein